MTETEYDPQTRAVVVVRVQPDDPALALRSTFGHDAHGNVATVAQTGEIAAGVEQTRVTTTQWDAEGVFPLWRSNALGHVAHVIHDPKSGAVIAEVDPAGLTTRRTFDGMYRVVGTALHSSPMGPHDGAPTTIEYLAADPGVAGSAIVTRTTTFAGQRVLEYFSKAGDLLERRWRGMAAIGNDAETIPAGADVFERLGYDDRGRQVARSVPQWVGQAPVGWHERELDLLDRTTLVKAPDETKLEWFEYQPNGASNRTVVEVRSSQGANTLLHTTWLDDRGRPEREIDADGSQACFTHGPFDALLELQRNCHGAGLQLTSSYEYDALGHVIEQTDPDLGTSSSTYNAFGELVQHTDGAAQTTTYSYDALGRLRGRTEAGGSAGFVYDTARLGALAADSSPDGITRTFEVDTFGRPWRTTTTVSTPSGADAYRFEWTYGPGGRIERIAYPTPDNEPALTARYVYDQAGYMRIVKDLGTGARRWRLDSGNPSAMPLTETYGDTTTTVRTYDPQRLWTERILHGNPVGPAFADLNYVWSPEGELTSRSDALPGQIQTEAFEYDKQWRVTKATVTNTGTPNIRNFTYDRFGNLTALTGAGAYAYDGTGRMTKADGANVEHDGGGNIKTYGDRSFTYTSFGKVRTVKRGAATLTMSYDAAGERVRRRQSDTLLDVVTLGNLYERRVSGQGQTLATSWRIPAGDRIVAQVVRTKNAGAGYTTSDQYLHDDELGSTVVVTATAVGGPSAVARLSSDPWGRNRSATNWKTFLTEAQTPATGIGFTGHRAELDHGLIDTGGRMYDPKIGRFMSGDPLVSDPYAGAAYNRYSYVGNRPLRFTDPTGWAASDGEDTGESDEEVDSNEDQLEGIFDYLVGDHEARVDSATANTAAGEGGLFDSAVDFYTEAAIDPLLGAGRALVDGLNDRVEGVKQIARDPAGAVRAAAEQVVADGKTVATAHARMYDAAKAKDYAGAAEIWWDSAGAAYRLASIVVGGGGATLSTLAPKAVMRSVAKYKRPANVAKNGSKSGAAAATKNRAGQEYPQVTNPGTGELIPFPGAGLKRVPVSKRVSWGAQERGAFIKEWHSRGLPTPAGGWSKYDIHHIRPREYGGTNAFDNLAPVERTVHQAQFNTWWSSY